MVTITRILFVVAFVLQVSSSAQTLPFLTDQQYKYLVGEISGDAAYEHLRFTTQFHKPDGGAPGLMEIAKYVEARAKEYGLQDVKLIKQAADSPSWEAKRAELWMVEPDIQLLASLVQTQLHIADYSRSADVTAEVIDIGSGLTDKDYEGKDVKGKIVFAWGAPGAVMNQAVWQRGAAGIIHHPDPSAIDYPLNTVSHPDQIRWSRVPQQSADGKPATFAFVLSHRQAVAFKNLLAASQTPVKVHAAVEANFDASDKWQVMVEGFIRGTDTNEQDVVLTGHMQEEKFSANDDGSGVGNTLEIARAMAKLIREGKLPKPKRNLRFWWVTEISSQRQYFADNPAEANKILCNINQDMVGANQAQDIMRVQNVTRLPFSRWHWLNDVVETVVEFVVRSNTQQLSELQAGTPANPYPKPILSRLGSRHRYNAAMVPFHTSTDHMTFIEAPIGKPGVTFTNWPDNYIHTSDDDLWNIDRTQLQRNAFAVAAIGFTVANADEKSLPIIANELYGRATVRLGEDFQVASTLLTNATNRVTAYKQALNQIQEATKREEMAIDALVQITKAARPLMSELRDGLKRTADGHLLNLRSRYLVLFNESSPNPIPLSAKETELIGVVPQLSAGPKEFLTKRDQIKNVPKLHALMAFEILNFVDGKRTGLEIYNAVSAEALRAGETYYGVVTAEMVGAYLQNLETTGVVKLQKK